MSRMRTPHTHEARARIGEHDAAQPPLRSQAHMHLLLDTGASTVKNSILFTRLWPWVSVCQPCRRWRSREHSVKSQSQGSEVVLNRNNPDVPRQEMPTLIDWPYMRYWRCFVCVCFSEQSMCHLSAACGRAKGQRVHRCQDRVSRPPMPQGPDWLCL